MVAVLEAHDKTDTVVWYNVLNSVANLWLAQAHCEAVMPVTVIVSLVTNGALRCAASLSYFVVETGMATGVVVAGIDVVVAGLGVVMAGLDVVMAGLNVVITGSVAGGGPNISPGHGFLVFFRSFTQSLPTLVKFAAQSHWQGVVPLTQHPLYMTASHFTHPRSYDVQVADHLYPR